MLYINHLLLFQPSFEDHSTTLQQMPELTGFLSNLGKNPIKNPRIPNSFICLHVNTTTDSLTFLRLILLLITSNGCDTKIATNPAKKAGIKAALVFNSFMKTSSFRYLYVLQWNSVQSAQRATEGPNPLVNSFKGLLIIFFSSTLIDAEATHSILVFNSVSGA